METAVLVLSVFLAGLAVRLMGARKRLIARSRELQDELRSAREEIDRNHVRMRILLDRHERDRS